MNKSARHMGTLNPDLKLCRTGKVGAVIPGTKREMYYCKIDNESCIYAMSFGFDYLCTHPKNDSLPLAEVDEPY